MEVQCGKAQKVLEGMEAGPQPLEPASPSESHSQPLSAQKLPKCPRRYMAVKRGDMGGTFDLLQPLKGKTLLFKVK